MIRELVFVAKYILAKDIAGSNLVVFPDDMFLVSHPRSGNTWLRFLVANLVHPESPVTYNSMEQIVADPTAQPRRFFKNLPRPRIIKSHQSFDPRFRRVLYIVRDPRDVCVSYYHFQRKYRFIADGYPIEDFTKRFVNSEASDFGSWGEHVGSWLAARDGTPGFLFIRYEDLVRDTLGELRKVASFLGVAADERQIAQAVERSSTDVMRRQEKLEQNTWVATRGRRKDIPFIGPAKPGRWKTEMPHVSVVLIESTWGPLMNALQYELTTQSYAPAPRFLVRTLGMA
jgi:Sulfotransferase domain